MPFPQLAYFTYINNFNPYNNPKARYYYFHLLDEEIEAQKYCAQIYTAHKAKASKCTGTQLYCLI